MSQLIIYQQQIDAISRLLNAADSVAIVCHMTPDGDALGSSLCLRHTLEALGKKATVVVPDSIPANLMFLPGAADIVVTSYHPEHAAKVLKAASLIFCLDFNDLKRIDRMAPLVEAAPAPRIVIDHHLNPVIEAEVVVSQPQRSSTCALLYLVIERLGLAENIPVEAATCCCAGMMTDTGNFSYNSNDPELYRILAALVAKGVDKDALYTKLFNINSLSRVRIMGYGQYAKMQVMPEHQCAIITLSRDELNELDYHRGDTEALVNVPLSIPGITYSIFLREDELDYVKVSMRSKGSFSVKDLCERFFGGGGHLNAAGGEVHDSLAVAVERIMAILPEADAMLPAPQPTM